MIEDSLGRPRLDNSPFLEDANFVGNFPNDSKVVGNKEQAQVVRFLQSTQEPE
jgi:hypothetical protein